MQSPLNLKKTIKILALNNRFSNCGISLVDELSEESDFLNKWLQKGFQGEMNYMNRNTEKRSNPGLLVKGAKSVITVLQNYYPAKEIQLKSKYRIAKYAYGKDYHLVIKDKLYKLVKDIEEITGKFNFRVFTDSAPIFDKAWAKRSGLGWIGKNTCLINKEMGSFFFIGHIICDLEISPDNTSVKNYCGSCTRCIDACPNNAITAPYELDSRKCISYLTIEKKEKSTDELMGKTNSWIFGCDICQDVCPWNKSPIPHTEASLLPSKELLEMRDEDWENLSETKFLTLFRGTAVERSGYKGLLQNIKATRLL